MIGLTTAALGFGSNPQPRPTSFSLCEPNPEYLVWDTKQQEDGLVLLETGVPLPQTTEPATYFGWLKVPILHDQPGLEEVLKLKACRAPSICVWGSERVGRAFTRFFVVQPPQTPQTLRTRRLAG